MAAARHNVKGLLELRLSQNQIAFLARRYGPEVETMCFTDFKKAADLWHLHQCLRATRGVADNMPCNSF